jgi:hypothetical protein
VAVELWYTDPANFGSELVEAVIVPRFTWTKEMVDSGFDYIEWMETYFPDGWEALKMERFTAVWAIKGGGTKRFPVWKYTKHDLQGLYNFGKKHKRVIVTELPAAYGLAREAAIQIGGIQEKLEDRCVLHVQGTHSYPLMFGKNLKSVGTWVRTDTTCVPNGKEFKNIPTTMTKWIRLLGFEVVDLEVPRNKTIYNIRSLTFAAEYWSVNKNFHPKMTVALAEWEGPKKIKIVLKEPAVKRKLKSDKIACDSCSLDTTCKYYRAESLCSLPRSEMADLTSYFKTRDSGVVIDGLGEMMALGAERLERGMEVEKELGELDPEVTRIYDSLFDKGVKLAKLIDPSLAKPSVGVVVHNQGGQTGILNTGSNPKVLVANIVRELEAQGISREHITPDVVARVLGRGDIIDMPQGSSSEPGAPQEIARPTGPGKL